jgi:hypothetical protein
MHFSCIADWEGAVSASLGLINRHSAAVCGTVAASLGISGSNDWTEERFLEYVTLTNRRQCYRFDSDCLFNRSYLHGSVLSVLKDLPVRAPTEVALQLWSNEFIRRFGSHVIVASEHGAQVKILATSSYQCKGTSQGGLSSLCNALGWLGTLGLSLCDVSGSEALSDCALVSSYECVVTGGDCHPQVNVCDNSTTPEDIYTFLGSGNMSSHTSAFTSTFLPISDILFFMGLEKEAAMLGKAVEYHACVAPRYRWDPDIDGAGGQSTCQCAETCVNGGVMDQASCTCTCRGDRIHGYRGKNCQETYGTCQPGPGTGNPDVAAKCAVNGVCAAGSDAIVCTAAEICCVTDFAATCCPWGSSCNCTSQSCSCVTRPTALV